MCLPGVQSLGVSRLAYTPDEAAESLGVSRSFFDQQIKPQLRVAYVGKRVIVPVKSLDEWLESQAVRA